MIKAMEKKDLLKVMLAELAESSESDDEEVIFHLADYCPRKRPKVENYIDIVHRYSDREFQRNFRLSRLSASMLITMFDDSVVMPKNNKGGTKSMSAEIHILSFLWYAGNIIAIRDAAKRFGVAESTFHRMLQRVERFLVNHVGPKVVKFPRTEEEQQVVVEGFKAMVGFPDTIGAIDVSCIKIRLPANKHRQTYINGHDDISLKLQAICDHKCRFTDVFTGPSSRIKEERIFQMSFIHEELPRLCGCRHILGDVAYPLHEFLLVPYKNFGNLTEEEKLFNKKHCETRVLIENAFGILKKRFQRLHFVERRTVLSSSFFILSCCVVHNICIDNNDSLDDVSDDAAESPVTIRVTRVATNESKKGAAKRTLVQEQLSKQQIMNV